MALQIRNRSGLERPISCGGVGRPALWSGGERQVHADLAGSEGAAPSGLGPEQVRRAFGRAPCKVGLNMRGRWWVTWSWGREGAVMRLWVPAPKWTFGVLLCFVLVFQISGF